MKRILVAYYSRTGLTEKMAEYIAEGVRFSGNDAEVKKIADIKDERDFEGYVVFIAKGEVADLFIS